jgi:hypothetical protein
MHRSARGLEVIGLWLSTGVCKKSPGDSNEEPRWSTTVLGEAFSMAQLHLRPPELIYLWGLEYVCVSVKQPLLRNNG